MPTTAHYPQTSHDSEQAVSTKPRYDTKAQWARAQAAQLRNTAHELRYTSSDGSSQRAANKYAQVSRLEEEARRFDGIAVRMEKKGQ